MTMNSETLKTVVGKSSDTPRIEVKAGSKASMQVLIGPDNAKNFFMRKFSMESGGGMPRHTNKVEHEQYVVGGRGRVEIGDEVFEVSSGDILFIPAEVPHSYLAISDEPFEFLCMVPNKEDQITIIEESC